ncbi:MAG: M55 family metallopeptidase [Bacteroidales bacterium]|nr:M55 family metallopeptidase [Bacteroidales bacterium]
MKQKPIKYWRLTIMKKSFVFLSALLVMAAITVSEVHGQKGLKVFISVDMEGITGVVHSDQVSSGGNDYQMARRWMTEETNAAIQGALDAGAAEIVVNDSHGSMRNILAGEVNPAARLITGSPKPLGMMQGIDETFHAVILIGYHAKAGTADATLDHTYSGGSISAFKVNGVEIGESEMNAYIAGHFNVPVVMVSGDKAVCAQVRAALGPQVVVSEVKEGIGRFAANTLTPKEAQKMIRANTTTALKKLNEFKPYKSTVPYQFEITFLYSHQAEAAMVIPGIERVSARTVRYTQANFLDGFKLFRALVTLASS